MHRHASLNGSDSLLFEADLKLLGASYERMNPAGLRFVASLGYDHLAFHREYLESNPWITSLPWLETLETRGPWTFHRVTPRLERLPRMPLEEVLAAWEEPVAPVEVPADSWITDRFTLPADVVVGPSRPVRLGWADERGRLVERPSRPSTSTSSDRASRPSPPGRRGNPGEYRLVFLDEQSRPIRSRPYRVRRDLETIVRQTSHQEDAVDAGKLVATKVVRDGGTPRVILENTSPFYLQANTSRDQVYLKSAGTMRARCGLRPGRSS